MCLKDNTSLVLNCPRCVNTLYSTYTAAYIAATGLHLCPVKVLSLSDLRLYLLLILTGKKV